MHEPAARNIGELKYWELEYCMRMTAALLTARNGILPPDSKDQVDMLSEDGAKVHWYEKPPKRDVGAAEKT